MDDLSNGQCRQSRPRKRGAANRIGACVVKFSASGRTLTVQERFTLRSPLSGADADREARQLLRPAEGIRKLALVLKR